MIVDDVTTIARVEVRHRLGLQAAVAEITMEATISAAAATEDLLAAAGGRLHGNDSKMLLPLRQMEGKATVTGLILVGHTGTRTVATVNRAWELRQDLGLGLAGWVLLPA